MSNLNLPPVTSSQLAFQNFEPLGQSETEEFWLMSLQSNKCIIDIHCVFKGTVDACPIHPRDIFRRAILMNASSLILAHNHPSGDSRPSIEDYKITKDLVEASQLLQIPINDHLILTKDHYWSFADHGYCFNKGLFRKCASRRVQSRTSFRLRNPFY